MTAALVMLSAVSQHAVAAGMATHAGMTTAGMTMAGMTSSQTADMAADADAPCPMSSECSPDDGLRAMACFAHCATVLGVLGAPVLVPVALVARLMQVPTIRPLASLHGPPEPHPPKSRA